ncbi:MAG: molybdopterin-dependent oxidoreductase, partial [Thermodesulfobacteriota bacterium]
MEEKKDQESIRTTCYMCYSCCGIKVQVLDGTVVGIEGDPANPHNQGKLCAKGRAGIASLYDPYRVRTPLKRTNPNKGIGVDPGWQEITWEEALATVADKLKKIRQDDPRKLVIGGLDFHFSFIGAWFASAFGTPNVWKGGADYYCGNGLHPITYLTLASFFAEPDLDNCNYCMPIGSQLGFMLNTNAVTLAKKMAEARSRGLKVVAVDPVGSNAAAKADEWVPIRPGTDSAFVLSMINVLVNELGIYDRDFLKTHTNAPYLVGADGRYVRDARSGKPLIWDEATGEAQPFDSPLLKAAALEGERVINGQACRPAFELFKKHLGKYAPERTEEITTVPAATVRRLAREFGQAARVGSTIIIDGKELPFRPVAATWNRGIAHKGCMMTGQAIQLLNMVVGALDVVGGLMGTNPVGPWWKPKQGPDGLIVPADMHLILESAFPARPVAQPETLELRELFPVASYSSPMLEESMLKPDKFGLNYQPEMLILIHSNVMMSTADPKRMVEVLKKFPYIVSFALQLDETVELADLVLPDTHYLERMVAFPNRP